jgi:tripartite ATP-independent transporter DctP family solute receptor
MRTDWRRVGFRIVGVLLVGWFMCSPGQGQTAEQIVFGHILEESTAHHRNMVRAAQEMDRSLEGRYKLKVVPKGQIGATDAQVIEGFKTGTAQMAYLSFGHLVQIYPPLSIGAGPFVFRDFDHWKTFRDSPLYKELTEGFEAHTGMKVLGLAYYGERHVTTKRPLTDAESLKGLLIRVPSMPTMILTFRALESKPVAIPFKETYQALQEGIVDAQENPMPTIKAMRFYEVTKFINLTAHISDAQLVVMDGKRWQSIPKKDQAVMEKIFSEAAQRVTEDVRNEELALAQSLLPLGAQIHAVDRESMIARLKPFHHSGYFPWNGSIYERIQVLR